MKKKIKMTKLAVNSFVTELDNDGKQELKGGAPVTTTSLHFMSDCCYKLK